MEGIESIPLSLEEDKVEPLALEELENNQPIERVQYDATIATLASERLKTQGIPQQSVDNASDIQPDSTYQRYSSLLQNNMEDAIRTELALGLLDAKLNIVKDLQIEATQAGSPEVLSSLLDLEIAYNVDQAKLVVIEEQAAAHIVDEGTTDTNRLEVDNNELQKEAVDPTFTSYREREANRLGKDLLIQSYLTKVIDKAGVNADTIIDGIQLFVPGVTGAVLDQNVITLTDKVLPGNDAKEQRTVFRAMSLEEQRPVLDSIIETFDDDPLHALMVIGYLNEMTDWDVWLENAGGFLDGSVVLGAALAPLYATVLGATKSFKVFNALRKGRVATAGVSSGNRASAIKQTVSVEEAVKAGDIPKDTTIATEAAELMLEKQLLPSNDYVGVGVSGVLRQSLVEIKAASEAFLKSPQSRLLDPVEREAMLTDMRSTLTETMINSGMSHADIMAVSRVPTTSSSNALTGEKVVDDLFGSVYNVFYGDSTGKGFVTLKDAQDHAKLMKLSDYGVTPIEVGGVHYIKVSRRADNQTGFISTIDRTLLNPRLNLVHRYLTSLSSLMGKKSQEAGHLTLASREAGMAAAKRLERVKDQVPANEKDWLDDVINLGTLEHDGVWYSVDTLRNRFKFTDKQVAGYKAFQAQEDLGDIVSNSSVYTKLNAEGYKEITLTKPIQGLETFNGKPISASSIIKPENKNIWNASTKQYEKVTSSADLTRLEGKGYRLVQLEGAIEKEFLTPVQYILFKTKDATINPLSLRQVAYRPGGRVNYQDKHFLKLGRLRDGPGDTKIIMRAKTFGVGTIENTLEAAKTYQKAAEAWIRNGTDAEIRTLTGGRFQNRTVFEDVIGKKNLEAMARNPELVFEVVQDGVPLRSVNDIISAGKASYLAEDVNELNTIQRMIAVQGSHKSHRGGRIPMFGENRLDDFDYGNPAAIVSPYESAASTITRAVDTMSISNFKTRQQQLWFNTFKSVLNQTDNPKTTPFGWLMMDSKTKYLKPGEGVGRTKAEDIRMIDEAKTMEEHLKMVLRTPTLYDKFRAEAMEGLIAKVAPTLKRLGVLENTLEELEKKDPVAFIRTITYHTKLGLGNPKQPATQLQAAALMATVEPVHGIEAILTTPMLGLMLLSENTGTLGTLARKAVRLAPGSNAERIKEGVEVLKKTNNWRLNTGALVETELRAVKASTYFQKLLSIGEQPFLNSERFNKISATYAAYLKWRKANPTVKIDDTAIDTIRTRGNALVASMDSVDQSQWQRGAMGMITQFWGYPMRALEMMAPTTLGGSKAFSTAEKWQVTLGQLAMHGVGGTLGVGPGRSMRESIRQEYIDRFNEEPNEEVMSVMEKGALSGLIFSTILDTNEVSYYQKGLNFTSAGPGELMSKFFSGDLTAFMDADPVGIKTIMDVGGDFLNLGKAMGALLPTDPTVSMLDAFEGISLEAKTLFVKNIASLKEADRLLWALQYEQALSASGEVVVKDFSTRRAIFRFFGIDSSPEASTFAAKDLLKGIQEDESKVTKRLSLLFREYITKSGVNKEGAEVDWAQQRNLYLSRVPENRRGAIMTSIINSVTKDSAFDARKKLSKHYTPKGEE